VVGLASLFLRQTKGRDAMFLPRLSKKLPEAFFFPNSYHQWMVFPSFVLKNSFAK